MEVLSQVMMTLVAVVSSTALWNFLSDKLKVRAEQKKQQLANDDTVLYRDDLKARVSNLEKLLLRSTNEKDELNAKVLQLTGEVSSLKVKVEFLEKENERLKNLK